MTRYNDGMTFLSSISIGLLIVAISYGIFTYLRIHQLIGQSGVLVKQAVPFERSADPAAPKILFVGDSTGVGVGALDPALSVAGHYAADFPDWTVENVAVSGSLTADLIPVLRSLPDHHYQRVVIQVGGNDIVRFSPLVQLSRDIETVLLEARRVSESDTGKVFLMTSGNVGNAPLFPRPFASIWEHRTRTVRALFITATEKTNATYIDLFIERPEADPFAMLPYRYHATDLFHPSAAGYGLWYTQLKQHLDPQTLPLKRPLTD
ncbi:MAG: GDSL-type esterase/lipase family protein [Candidatus Moraniibacteriota bacterium]